MPTKREREYYRAGFDDGIRYAGGRMEAAPRRLLLGEGKQYEYNDADVVRDIMGGAGLRSRVVKPKRKLSAWNKYVKANSKKPRFRYRNGKLNLKKMAIAFRKTPAGRKKKARR